MRREIPFGKIYLIVSVLLIVVINILAVAGNVRFEIAQSESCSDYHDPHCPGCVVDVGTDYDIITGERFDAPYSGTITKIETTSDNIKRIKVESEYGERWFTVHSESSTSYLVGSEVTLRCYADDPENTIVIVLKNEVPLAIRVRNAIFSALSRMLIPDSVVAVVLFVIYKLVLRFKRGEKVLIPVIALFAFVIAVMNFQLVSHNVRAVISEYKPADDSYVLEELPEFDAKTGKPLGEPYSGTVKKIEITPDNTMRIKVVNEEGERWFTIVSENQINRLYQAGHEVTFRCLESDPDNKVVSVLKHRIPLKIIVLDTILRSLLMMLIPDSLYTAIFVTGILFYSIGQRVRKGEKIIVPTVVIILLLLLIGGYMVWSHVEYKRRAEAAVTPVQAHAPVIYLYSEDDTPINVKIDLDGEFTYTYPAYDMECGWTVTASSDGTLTDSEGRTYDFLFWEGEVYMEPDLSRGFCVAGEDTRAFLTDAAATLGLNDKEADFFISYWAPRMEQNAYNVIAFQTTSFDEATELEITPEPDVLLRVNMLWYPSDTYVDIPEQDLADIGIPLSERHGFTAVEWGGEMLGE